MPTKAVIKCTLHDKDRCRECYGKRICALCLGYIHKDSKDHNVHYRCYRDLKDEIKA